MLKKVDKTEFKIKMDPILTNLISTQEKRHNIKRSSNSEVISNGNKPFMIGSRSPSPDESIINTKFPASKPNQVSDSGMEFSDFSK